MRIGYNPHKDKIQPISDFFHQVIIPIYIPNLEGYFEDSFEILKYTLESLFRTSHKKTYFTLINNGSCKNVVEYLNDLLENGLVHEVMHTSSIGKLNSVLKGITGHNFKMVTISDADVLFLNDWQEETYKVFNSFSKCGAVSPVPSPKVLKQYTSNAIVDNLFSRKLKFSKVLNPNALQHFAKSIGNPNFYNEYHLESYLTIQENNQRAVIGAGHFVATYRGDIFSEEGVRYSKYSLGGGSENKILDEPVLLKGYWRLSTLDNYAYHMGNKDEEWMSKLVNNLSNHTNKIVEMKELNKVKTSKLALWFYEVFFKILKKKIFWFFFLRYKGLSDVASKNY